MPRKLRLGLVGTGVAARDLYLPAFHQLERRIELVACANRRRSKAEAFARVAKIPKVVDTAEELVRLPEVDAVLLSLPIDAQPEYVLQALGAGKPVLSEKPVAPSVAAGKRLLKAAARFDVPWMVAENFAFMPHVALLADWIQRGRLGEVRVVSVTQMTFMDERNPFFNTSWRAAPKHVGGFIVDGGVHVAHVVRRCFGMPVIVRGASAGFDAALPPVDTAVAILEFESGALGTWTSCFSAHYEGPLLRVYGEKASATLSWGGAELIDAKGKTTAYPSKVNSFAAQFAQFADVVQKGKPVGVTPQAALEDLTLVEAILGTASKRSGARTSTKRKRRSTLR